MGLKSVYMQTRRQQGDSTMDYENLLSICQRAPIRKKFFNIAFVALVAAMSFPTAALAKDVVVTEAENGKKVCLEVGDTLTLQLEGNPTTGYLWEVASKEMPYLKSYRVSTSLIGSGGTYTFTFRAESKGSMTMQVVYARPWEKDVPPAKTIEIPVVID